MIYNIYAIKDDASTFLAPTIDATDATAIRQFKAALSNAENSIMYCNKKDFSLYKIGTYDSETGLITPYVVPALVFRGSDIERIEA